jgi:hypothetical protein
MIPYLPEYGLHTFLIHFTMYINKFFFSPYFQICKHDRGYEDTIKVCDKAIELKPGYALVWINKGLAFTDMKKV